ncbi:bifunctional 2-polyprenyl-6-hydroxyphenol methylase/3-demethylubiquinol 3-O-methyltransferase UbiG [Thiothrix subterranea]|uniref:Ubiquinone biosynthesis O-methyltransferase n=1 Tax=Thiothrix subterranea TaxID=2735563 RepID=A0AA51MR33_9GAMM|nr:bifunctional 2-polyprenyl-6-hydroxyphenol methylase/3-demethylubiquinol 3-O-methyltransferase UbiG [Thiothrix subterranea]MDQ5770191.1 bifunctional 2-polyprenyl-6-hydroxyphenol methylase/3-demethylubiquinol 3-O-methyltransferase UbiG [Thiothrix subterranea]WML88932.1 bifunctional 2-polyprenyl-6-hydroxyphenol methylase/3-demethylubiquinol 3-O-methyltransferase UbiG [Thiothrix subterranea]
MTNPTPNVDPNEIRKFEDLAWRWWDRDSEFKPLHDINPLRLNYIDDHAHLQGKNVIDIGCGGGILAESMARRGAIVTGIDMGATPLEVAELHALESQVEVTYRQISAEAIATEAPEQFDVVTCMEMLEHVPDPASVIAACAALVKPGGDVFFSTLNRNPKAFALAIVGAEYVMNMLPKGTHEYAKFIKPSELERWARSVGLELRNIAGMTYNPLFQSYRLGKDVDVNYLMYFKKEM